MSFNLHIYQTGVSHESRLIRHCEALRDLGGIPRVEFLGCAADHDQDVEFGDGLKARLLYRPDVRHSSLISKLSATRRWGRRVAEEAIKMRPDLVTCHSLPVLPVCVHVKKKLGCALMYEPHELETETIVSRGIRQAIAKRLEKTLIKHCDGIIVVSEGIADWYSREYRIDRPSVVRNLPTLEKNETPVRSSLLRDLHGIPDGEILFLYQGYVGAGRRVHQYLQVFAELGCPYHIVFMGNGELEGEIRAGAAIHDNIHYQEAVPSSEVLTHTVSADVGLCGVENACLSYFFSLPNKLFEFMASGIPSLVPAYPEMKRVVESTHCGWVHGESNEELVKAICSITPASIDERRDSTRVAVQHYRWEDERHKLVDAYAKLGTL